MSGSKGFCKVSNVVVNIVKSGIPLILAGISDIDIVTTSDPRASNSAS